MQVIIDKKINPTKKIIKEKESLFTLKREKEKKVPEMNFWNVFSLKKMIFPSLICLLFLYLVSARKRKQKSRKESKEQMLIDEKEKEIQRQKKNNNKN